MKKISIAKKWDAMSSAAKASLVLMAAQLIIKGLSVLTSPIYTRLLSTDEYGQVSLFFSWYEILIVFTGLCLSKGVFNNGMMDFKKDREEFTLSLYTLSLISTACIGCITILICEFVYNFIKLPIYLIVYMFVLLALEEGYALWVVRQRFEYKYKATFIASVTMAVVAPICGIAGILFFDNNPVAARIMGARNVFAVIYCAAIVSMLYKAGTKIKVTYWKYALRFNLPLIPHYLSLHVLNHSDRIMISELDSKATAGIYSVAYNGASIIKIFWQSINASLIPWTYEKCEKKQYKELNIMVQIILTCYAVVCVCFMVLAPEIMKILAPASYMEGIYAIPSITAGVYFSSVYYIFANVVYYYKKPKYVMYSSCFAAIANVVLNYLFIPKYGFLAAGYTTLVCYVLQAIFDYFAMRKTVKEKIYDIKPVIIISLLIIIAALVVSLIYDNYILRYFVLLVALLFFGMYVRKNRKILIDFIKTKKKK